VASRRSTRANDGIVSTASLVVRVAAAAATRHQVLVAGLAGVVAGALSMAAGEYVSVSSQADTEQADTSSADSPSRKTEVMGVGEGTSTEPG
jgi:vacuolar iron transporter family protein